MAPANQSLLQDLSVEVHGDKVVPVQEIIDLPRPTGEPLVEITASPQTNQPVVRIGRVRRPQYVEVAATETILAEAEQRQAKAQQQGIDSDGETEPSTPCNASKSNNHTSADDGATRPQQPQTTTHAASLSNAREDQSAAADETPDPAVQQRNTANLQTASARLITAAKEMITPAAAKFNELRAKRKANAEEKRVKDDAARLESASTEAKGDLNRIASALEAKSNGGGSGSPPKSKARQIVAIAESKGRSAWESFRSLLARNGIHGIRDVGNKIAASLSDLAAVAFAIRIGVGALFVIGGWNKLSKLLSPANSDAIVASYTSTTGYINEFFMGYLFGAGSVLTPWSFLTALSAFELVTGLMLIAGLLVRPVALIYAFLLWTFVVSLPVVTTNGIDPGVNTYMAPALLVQIRDVALSGIMFALFGLGSGIRSLDVRIFGAEAAKSLISWDVAGVLLRLSTAVVLIVGGAFAGMPNIKTFIEPGIILLAIGLVLLWGGRPARYAAAATCAVLVIYMLSKIGIDKGLLGSLNAIKRELALFAAAFVISARGCGELWTVPYVARQFKDGITAATSNLGLTGQRQEKSAA